VKVLITGAAGLIGTLLRERLSARFEICAVDLKRQPGVRRVDTRSIETVSKYVAGMDAVVDLAAVANADAPWEAVSANNLRAVATVLEAAHLNAVPRVIFASSNHVTGLYEEDEPYRSVVAGRYDGLDPAQIPLIGPDWPMRPDGPYGMSKALGEAMCRTYSASYGISTISLRIGTVNPADRPTGPREFATLLSHDDLCELVACALTAPASVQHGIYYGVSSNTWRIWDTANATSELGFVARDDAESFRATHGASSVSDG